MTSRPRDQGQDLVLDLLLGQLDASAHRLALERIADDPEAAVELASTAELVDRLRTLRVEPTGRVAAGMGVALVRRERLRRLAEPRRAGGVWVRAGLSLAFAAAMVFVALACHAYVQAPPAGRPAESPVVVLPPAPPPPAIALPGVDPLLLEKYPRLREAVASLTEPELVACVVSSDGELAELRLEFQHRRTPELRREMIRRGGGTAGLDDRVQDLAGVVAAGIGRRLDAGDARIAETSAALRALLAAGSTDRLGAHAGVVCRAGDWLEAQLEATTGAELAHALAALTELAIVRAGPTAEKVGIHGQRLAAMALAGGARDGLLTWETTPQALADTGRVLQLAPAFGVHPALARRAREQVAEHLLGRTRFGRVEQPEVLAALLYGFADLGNLVDVDSIDQRLAPWRTRMLRSSTHYTALHHLAWSLFPPRPGWAELQSELRGLASHPTPAPIEDAAALLLTLATGFAAPGVSDVLNLTED